MFGNEQRAYILTHHASTIPNLRSLACSLWSLRVIGMVISLAPDDALPNRTRVSGFTAAVLQCSWRKAWIAWILISRKDLACLAAHLFLTWRPLCSFTDSSFRFALSWLFLHLSLSCLYLSAFLSLWESWRAWHFLVRIERAGITGSIGAVIPGGRCCILVIVRAELIP